MTKPSDQVGLTIGSGVCWTDCLSRGHPPRLQNSISYSAIILFSLALHIAWSVHTVFGLSSRICQRPDHHQCVWFALMSDSYTYFKVVPEIYLSSNLPATRLIGCRAYSWYSRMALWVVYCLHTDRIGQVFSCWQHGYCQLSTESADVGSCL